MGRIMAIDYGRVRTGLAVTDPLRIIATALETVATPTLIDYLKHYCREEEVNMFVVGQARHLDGTPSESMVLIEPFVAQLKTIFPDKEVARIDERFTSKIAMQAIIDSGTRRKERRDKGRIDRVAATIMLQDYMRQQSNLMEKEHSNTKKSI
ncbi:MAG: Holliday junction resolvase RuvX [Bacteroidales bacterium]|nr:Holliday junction resolvase RuvX [Bacteroidales bacterium]